MDKNSKEFLDLKDKWYKKLEATGFKDIEQDEDNLKSWSINLFKNKFNETTYLAKQEYYRLAGQFLNEHLFKSNKEKVIWEMHSQGLGRPEIVKRLKKRKFKTYGRQVQEILESLVKEMITKCR